ncbi:AmmeMemoRadiSam system radical SAM enzyme [Gottschalkiaceae bacterium SANA]|nr:AmmeMemoRadiSam system radical SAM enzyme [Gottschalkiaceae bacterium SANA]
MEAGYYVKVGNQIRCELCPNRCVIEEGKTGVCGVRKHIKGKLVTESYGKVTALQVDPIEKKPLAYFHPGVQVFSIGSYGCNLKCPYCQNHPIAHGKPASTAYSPDEVVEAVQRRELNFLAFTYNEPLVGFEFVLDTAKLAKEAGITTIMVSNGYVEGEPLADLLPYIDAWNIDLKGFYPQTYQRLGGQVQPVLKTIEQVAAVAHVEITILLVPGINDDREELKSLFEWLGALDPSIPLHLNRYFPAWNYHEPPTSVDWMKAVAQDARHVCHRVNLGNIWEVKV